MRQGISKEFLKGTRRHHGGYNFPWDTFLFSRIGQQWDKVHSELSAEFDRRTYAGYQFWRDVDWHLATKCWIGEVTGAIFHRSRWHEEKVDGFYVHPLTGCIGHQNIPAQKREAPPVEKYILTAYSSVEKILGIWYYVNYRDGWSGKEVFTKRQLNKKYLLANGLTNNSPDEIVELKKEKLRLEKERASLMYKPF